MKENFDDILKRRWEERSFPVDDGHRAEMLELLNQQKRRRVFPFWWFGGLAIVMIAGGYLMYAQKSTPPVEMIQPSKDAEKSAASGKTEIASGMEENATHEKDRSGIALNETPVSTNPSIAEQNVSKGSTKSNPSTSQPTRTKNDSKRINTSGHKTPIQPTNKTPSKNAIASEKESTRAKPAGEKTYQVDDEAAQSFSIVSKPVTVVVEPEPEMEYNETLQKGPEGAQRKSNMVPMMDPLLLEGIIFTDIGAMNSIQPEHSANKPFYLFGETGAGLVFASKYDYTTGWTLRVGAGLGYRLSSKLQLSWAAGYMMQHGGFDFERTSTVNLPGFGVRSSFNSLTPETLHYVYTRLGLQYRMHRHILAAHGGVQYLYGAYGTIITQTQDQFVAGLQETTKESWLKTDGLNKLLWTADIAYGYQITPRWSVMAGTDIYFSGFTVEDTALANEGYYWKGSFSSLHPFITLNYLIHGHL